MLPERNHGDVLGAERETVYLKLDTGNSYAVASVPYGTIEEGTASIYNGSMLVRGGAPVPASRRHPSPGFRPGRSDGTQEGEDSLASPFIVDA